MKKLVFIVLLSSLVLFASCSKKEEVSIYEVSLESLNAKGCYMLGMAQCNQDLQSGATIYGGYYARGVLDGKDKSTSWFTIDELGQVFYGYLSKLQSGYSFAKEEAGITTFSEIESLKKPKKDEEKFSYALGYASTPYSISELPSDFIDINAYISGYLSALYGKEPRLGEEDGNKAFSDWYGKAHAEYEKEKNAALLKNLEEAEAFLNKNKRSEGVVVLDDGVQLLKSVENDTGAIPSKTDTVVVDYTLTLLDGTVADQGTDVTFPLTSLIPGFVSGVTNMHVGEKAKVYIHPDLGYGENDLGQIKPNSLLIFDITLKSVEGK